MNQRLSFACGILAAGITAIAATLADLNSTDHAVVVTFVMVGASLTARHLWHD
jgi:hypothetical protein